MTEACQEVRIVYYPPNDLAATHFIAMIPDALERVDTRDLTIQDAIEIYQCKLYEKDGYRFLSEIDDGSAGPFNLLGTLYPHACKILHKAIEEQGVGASFRGLPKEYQLPFFDFAMESKALTRASEEEASSLLKSGEIPLSIVVRCKGFVQSFHSSIREAMLSHPEAAANIIVSSKILREHESPTIYLPPGLNSKDILSFFEAYVNSDNPNINYLNQISRWKGLPSSQDIQYAAEVRADEIYAELFPDSGFGGFSYGVGIAISEELKACGSISFDKEKNRATFTYGEEWLLRYLDYPTILNNFIYVFGIADLQGNLKIGLHDYKQESVADMLKVQGKNDYHLNTVQLEQMRAKYAVKVYCDFLKYHEVHIEDVLSWFFNEYIGQEFSIEGFRIAMPEPSSSDRDKCGTISSAIETVLKTFSLYVDKGTTNQKLLKRQKFGGFNQVPSLLKEKYLRPSQEILNAARMLRSTQSPLAHMTKEGKTYTSFIDLLRNEQINVLEFDHYRKLAVEWLVNHEYLGLSGEGQFIVPTSKTLIATRFWDIRSQPNSHQPTKLRATLDSLIENGEVEIYSSLFAEEEADFLSYMFDDRKYENALALKNLYSHADPAANPPEDYLDFLVILISIALKINEELCLNSDPESRVDLIDYPVFEESMELCLSMVSV